MYVSGATEVEVQSTVEAYEQLLKGSIIVLHTPQGYAIACQSEAVATCIERPNSYKCIAYITTSTKASHRQCTCRTTTSESSTNTIEQ